MWTATDLLSRLLLQAQHISKVFSVAEGAVRELHPATAVATIASAEALRKVLEAQQQLSCHPSEAALKQVISTMREAAPELQQACWLLVSQQEELRAQVSERCSCCHKLTNSIEHII